MIDTPAEAFYTGLVADLYRPLRSSSFDPADYRDLIARHGEPALELGCGDGEPLLDLRAMGIDVDGIDASPDMIDRLHGRAAERNLDVTAWVATMQAMRPARRYRTIFLAGPTFNLLPDDAEMTKALVSLRGALAEDGTAIVPLFVPESVAPERIGRATAQRTPAGTISWRVIAADRDEDSRTQTLTLRYERETEGALEWLERDWVTHWVGWDLFRELADGAGLRTVSAPHVIDGRTKDVVLRR